MNKKILMIADTRIYGLGGGSIDETKHYDALRAYAKEENDCFSVICMDEDVEDKYPFQVKKNRTMDIGARLLGHSTYLWFVWEKLRKQVISYAPDVVFLGRSRMGFIARDIKRQLPACRIICSMENIECDFAEAYFANKTGAVGRLCAFWEKMCVYRDEKMMMENADALHFLTRRDKERARKKYNTVPQIQSIVPICINTQHHLSITSKQRNVVFIGSLNYDANVQAITSFINEVWEPYYGDREDIHLIIGGRDPSEELCSIFGRIKNITVCKNYRSLESFIPLYSLVIAPIQLGAGMKVKVAETLSMGLMIAASDEALVGYEDALENDEVSGIIRANAPKEYKNAIDRYCALAESELDLISRHNMGLYERFYSYAVSRESVKNILRQVLSAPTV